MKAKSLKFIIPTTYIFLYVIFMSVVSFVIDKNTQGNSEIYGLIYSIGFFVNHPFYSFFLGFLIIIPLPLLVFAVIKKRKNLIIGFSISTVISIVLVLFVATT